MLILIFLTFENTKRKEVKKMHELTFERNLSEGFEVESEWLDISEFFTECLTEKDGFGRNGNGGRCPGGS